MTVFERSKLAAHDSEFYAPLSDYAMIGDCHGAAFVSRDGSVDWCCLGRFDVDPVFCRILDAAKGGYLSIQPTVPYEVTRTYLAGTNILRTVFITPKGKIAVTDFMPVGRKSGAGTHDYVTLTAPFWLVRVVESLEGTTKIRVTYRPTPDFVRCTGNLTASPGGVSIENGPYFYGDGEFTVGDEGAETIIELCAGERKFFIVSGEPIKDDRHYLPARAQHLFKITKKFWEEWSSYCQYSGPYLERIQRCALLLKLLTYAPTGSIVSAPTTSLPDMTSGKRNWDARRCWLQDATLTHYVLSTLGYGGEASRFSQFLARCCVENHPQVPVSCGIDGDATAKEEHLDHLEGYRGGLPDRTGDGVVAQPQLHVYGEVLDWACLAQSLGMQIDGGGLALLDSLADVVAMNWMEPDRKIRSMPGPPRQLVSSKIMSWVAMDRAIRMFGDHGGRGEIREAIRKAVLTWGVDPEHGYLRQTFEGPETDTEALRAPLMGFPLPRSTFERTVNMITGTLQSTDLLKDSGKEDLVRESEGPVLTSSLWLVDALLFLDREEEAKDLYKRLLSYSNDVGLFPQVIDPKTQEFLGNFPRAVTHLSLIHTAMNFTLYKTGGVEALYGIYADRARQTVPASTGLRALWTTFKKSVFVRRFWSSDASILILDPPGTPSNDTP